MHTTSTVQHDLSRLGPGTVAVYNGCTDTTRHMNGIVANLHPSEGVWLFRFVLARHYIRACVHTNTFNPTWPIGTPCFF